MACSEKSRLYSFRGQTMGTTYSIKYFTKESNPEKVKIDVDKKLIDFNQSLSTYISDSEISRFNKSQSKDWIEVSDIFLENIKTALDIFHKTQKLYDVSISKLIDRWSFGSRKIKNWTLPTAKELNQIRKCIGLNKFDIDFDKKRIRKKVACLELNFSSLAKGQGVDLVSDYLYSLGYTNTMVEIGGEVRVRGRKINKPWRIGVESPDLSKGLQSIVTLKDSECVATSGGYRNYFTYEGVDYSHTINPISGFPVEHNMVATTVIAKNCILADAWATALLVVGPIKSLELAKKEQFWVQFVINNDGELETTMTSKRN